MNSTPDTLPREEAAADTCAHVEDLIRHHPVVTTLASLGIGCALGMAIRELLTPPPTPKQRAVQLLEDIQGRLSELVDPAYDRLSSLTSDGVDAMKSGYDTVSESPWANRLKHLFS